MLSTDIARREGGSGSLISGSQTPCGSNGEGGLEHDSCIFECILAGMSAGGMARARSSGKRITWWLEPSPRALLRLPSRKLGS